MLKVKARSSEDADQLLRRFKKLCEKEGIVREVKKHAFYEKPSITRRRKRRQAVKTRMQVLKLRKSGY